MAITGQPQAAGVPLTLELTSVKLCKRSGVKGSQIRTLSTERIGRNIGRTSPDELDRFIEGLSEILGWAKRKAGADRGGPFRSRQGFLAG